MNAVVGLALGICTAIILYWVFFTTAWSTNKSNIVVICSIERLNSLLEFSRWSLIDQMTFCVCSGQPFKEVSTDVICIVLPCFCCKNVNVSASASCLPHCASWGLHLGNFIPNSRVLLSGEIWWGRDILALLGLSGWNVTQQGENSKCWKLFKHMLQILLNIKLRDSRIMMN